MASAQKRNSYETDMFFIIESLTVYFEKFLEILDEPLKNYSKSEWSKFKELLTSAELSPCKCFSYANQLKLVKPSQIVKVATFKLGDLGENSKKPENTITAPSLISINSNISPAQTKGYIPSQTANKTQYDFKESDQKKTKNSISNQLSVPQQTTQATNNLMNLRSSSPTKGGFMNSSQITTAFTTTSSNTNKTSPNVNTVGSNYQQTSTLQYLNNNITTPSSNKYPAQSHTSFANGVYSVQQTYQNPNQIIGNGYVMNSISRQQNNSINASTNNLANTPQSNTNYSNIYQPKTAASRRTSAQKIQNINKLSSTNLNNSISANKKGISQFDKVTSNTKTPTNAHIKAQKSLQIDIKENNLAARNNANSQVNNNTSVNRIDTSKQNNNSIGNLFNSSKTFNNSQSISSNQFSTSTGTGASNLLTSFGSQGGTQNTNNMSSYQKFSQFSNTSRFNQKGEASCITDRKRSKGPEMQSVKTESVLIECSPLPAPYMSNGIFNINLTQNNNNINNFTQFATQTNSINNGGLQQLKIDMPFISDYASTYNNSNYNESTITPQNEEAVPQRKKARKETRKLSLEKFQNNIDTVQNQQNGESTLVHNKGFQQVLLNRFDMLGNTQNKGEKKREPSPVNKRVGCEKISEFNNFQKLKSDEQQKQNPLIDLLQKVQNRIEIFKMDSLTIELVAGKFTNVESNKNKDKKAEQGGFQQRQEVKRDNLKKYSVFAKNGQGQQNLKKVDDQITKVEQQKLNNPQIKPKKRDNKNKLIF